MCESRYRCTDPAHRPFARGAAEIRAGRRTVLTGAAAGMVFSTAALGAEPAAAAPNPKRTKKRCYVLVTDGCRPDEVDSGLMPNLFEMREQGMWWPRATSMPVMETIPNHVMMMTGVRPDKSGVPANSIYDREEGVIRDLDRPSDLKRGTVIQKLNRKGFRTGTVLSKEYLYGIFGQRATYQWEPAPIIPVSGHAPDIFTMQATMEMLDEFDPHLMFVNLGDIDRLGHTDYTGTTLQVLRQAGLAQTDVLIGQFLDELKASGRWEDSIVIVLADHSMDWSNPGDIVQLQPLMDADDMLNGNVVIADNGGADLVYWTGPARQRKEAIKRIKKIARQHEGVLKPWNRKADWLRLGPEAGDVVVFCKAGWRFSDPDFYSNPIPGNHGHPATRPIPFFIGGGHPAVKAGQVRPHHARTIDVAPTVAKFFGLGLKPYEGRARI